MPMSIFPYSQNKAECVRKLVRHGFSTGLSIWHRRQPAVVDLPNQAAASVKRKLDKGAIINFFFQFKTQITFT